MGRLSVGVGRNHLNRQVGMEGGLNLEVVSAAVAKRYSVFGGGTV